MVVGRAPKRTTAPARYGSSCASGTMIMEIPSPHRRRCNLHHLRRRLCLARPPARRARHASLPPAARPVTPLAKSLPPPTRSWATPPPVPISPARVARAPPRPRISVVSSTRHPGEWTIGDILWGIEGTLLLFEDRYDVVDHIHINRLSSARLMQSRDRRLLEVFVGNGAYGTEDNAV
ncbi:hypothetical protein B0H14DRAFT_2598042 [Mycena olivaceomarginata]|nr:hypothetical protein B0H14DRAFT_2598042 [Mycena olivaceomarginata]